MSKEYEIHKQKKAEADLINIWRYSFENWGEEKADEYLDDLDRAIQLLAENPYLGIACDYIRNGYRQLHINKHMIFYRISSEKIRIIRVLGEDMLFAKHF